MRALTRWAASLNLQRFVLHLPQEHRPVIVMLRIGLGIIVVLRSLLYSRVEGAERDPLILIASLLVGVGILWGALPLAEGSPHRRTALWGAIFNAIAVVLLELMYVSDTATHFYTLNLIVVIDAALIGGLILSLAFWSVGAVSYILILAWAWEGYPTDSAAGEAAIRIVLGLAVALAAGILARELQKAVERERSARARLDRSERAKHQLIRLISHDLRNPLAVVMNFASLLKKGRERFSEAEITKALEQIDHSARALDDRLEELLEIDALFGVGRTPRSEVTSLAKFLDEVLREMDLRGRHLVVDASDQQVRADLRAVRVLLKLLIGAALRHVGEDQEVRVEAEARGENLVFSVSPSWVREPASLEGGLALIRALAEDHEGSLRTHAGVKDPLIELSTPGRIEPE